MAESYSVEAILSARDKGFASVFQKATSATESLGSRIKKGLGLGAMMAAGTKIVNTATNALTSNLGNAISRYDQLNKFPKTLNNLGISTKAAQKATDQLSEGIDGLPTTLDSATQGVARFVSANGDIKKSTKYFLAMNNAMIAGGASTELQTAATEQLAQAYSKGKMDMMEWRSLQVAMPGQLNQIAKAMGKTSTELGEGLRNGTISMDEFMDTVVKLNKKGVDGFASFSEQALTGVGGIETSMSLIQSAVTRGIANCITSIDTMLANNGMPSIAQMMIKARDKVNLAFDGIRSAIEKVDLKSIAKAAAPYWNLLRTAATTAGAAIKGVGGFLLEHSATIAKVLPAVAGLVGAFKLYRVVSSFAPGIKGFGKALTGVAQKGLAKLAPKLFTAAAGEVAVGKAGKASAKGVTSLKDGFNSLQKCAGIALIIGAIAGLALALKPLASLGSEAVLPLLTFGVVVAGLGGVLASLGAKLQASMGGIIAFAASVSAMALAMAPIASTGTEGAIAMGALGVVVAGLAVTFALLGPALNAAIPGMLAFGATAALIGAGLALASVAIKALTPFVKQLGNSMSQVAGAVASAVSKIVSVVGGTLCNVMRTAGNIVSQMAQSIGNGFKTVCDGVTSVVDAISGGLTNVLNGIANIIQSVGMSARNAGEGFKLVAEGISQVSELSIGSIAKSLGAVALGLGNISTKGKTLLEAATGLQGIVMALTVATGSIASFNAATLQLSMSASGVASGVASIKAAFSNFVINPPNVGPIVSAFNKVVAAAKSAGKNAGAGLAAGMKSGRAGAQSAASAIIAVLNSTAGKAKASGQRLGSGFSSGMQGGLNRGVSVASNAGKNIGNRFTATLKSGLNKGKSIASQAVTAVTSKLRSGQAAAHSAGAMIGAGFASGMRAYLGQVQAAAAQMAAAADAAIRAKAKIHSPSRVTKKSGKYTALGFAAGILKYTTAAVSASKVLATSTFKSFKKANGNYEKLGESLAKKYKEAFNTKADKTVENVKNLITAQVNALKKKNKKAATSYSKAGTALTSAFSKAFKSGANKAISATEKALTKLGETYQKKYDAIIEARANFKERLSDFGSLYTADSYGNIALTDFKAAKAQVEAYAKNLEKLKKILPSGLMDEILQLDTASGLAYTNQLLKMNTQQLKDYGKTYTSYTSAATKASNTYYQSQLDSLKNNFNKAVTQELSKLKKKLTTIGQNAMKGFVSGMNSKKKTLDSVGKSLANTVIKAFKKKLKIHSPSKVLASVGAYTGEGFLNGLETMQQKVERATRDLISIPAAIAPAFEGSFYPELSADYDYYRTAEYTIIVPVEVDGKEMARVTAPYTQAELNKMEKRDNRKRGIR